MKLRIHTQLYTCSRFNRLRIWKCVCGVSINNGCQTTFPNSQSIKSRTCENYLYVNHFSALCLQLLMQLHIQFALMHVHVCSTCVLIYTTLCMI